MRVVSPRDPSWEPGCETARELLAPRMPAGVPGASPLDGLRASADVEWVKQLTPEAQERALELIRQREVNPWRPFYCPNPRCDGKPHDNWAWNHARAEQRPPDLRLDWLVWLLLGGRGGGKTRTGAETIHKIAKKHPRIHLVAPTGPDIRDTMVEGESGLLATAPPDFMPLWEPSKKRLTWPNGAKAFGFSGEEPDRLRGPQCYWAWIDEPALMPLIGGENGVWNNLLFGLRLGRRPRIVATTTPRSTKWMKALVADQTTVVSRFSSYANLDNLAENYKRTVLDRFEGTRLGRQELYGEILQDVEGALWMAGWIQYIPHDKLPDFTRIVVSIDPAGTANKQSDETGIIVLGITGDVIYVLSDRSGKYSPSGWATAAVHAYNEYSADAIIAEKNYGGDMVREVLEKNGAKDIKIELVTSRRGKALRAEPIAALYEKGSQDGRPVRVYHVQGATPTLEEEMTMWVPGKGDSPNRVDALVHGATSLAKLALPSEIAVPTAQMAGRLPELSRAY